MENSNCRWRRIQGTSREKSDDTAEKVQRRRRAPASDRFRRSVAKFNLSICVQRTWRICAVADDHRAHCCLGDDAGCAAFDMSFWERAPIQNNSGLSQGPVHPFGGRLSVRGGTQRRQGEFTMSEQAVEERRGWASDIMWVVLYSILVLLAMLLWV